MMNKSTWQALFLLALLCLPDLLFAAGIGSIGNVPDIFDAAKNGAQAAAPTLTVMLTNIAKQIPYLYQLITVIAYIAGFFCIFRGIYELKQYGHGMSMMSVQHSLKGPVLMLMFGAALIFLPEAARTMLITVFGNNDVLGYPSSGTADPSFNLMGTVLVRIVQFVGTVAFIRGLLLMYRMGQGQAQPGTMSKGVTHLIGGVLAMNVIGTANVLGSTLGVSW